MKELFKDILSMEGVKGVLLLSPQGDIIFKEMSTQPHQKPESLDWRQFTDSLNGIRETDLVFENARIYIRKTGSGYLMILMDFFASAAMVRLNTDILLPALKPVKGSKGFKRLFKK
jgi:hypothetical protein